MSPAWLSLVKKNYLAAVLAFLGLILIGFGLVEYARQPQQTEAVPNLEPISLDKKLLTIDVEGAVINPGIYKLPIEARVNDALVAASGFADDADADWVEKNLNLAEKILDGSKLYIPRKGESAPEVAQVSGSSSTTALININTASSKSLEALPGIGPVTAGKIIDGRPYAQVADLSTRKIVSSSVYSKIKDMVTVH